jgi:hypothetical protein
MFVQTVIRRLPLPTWLAEWLNNLSIAVTEIRNTVNDIAYEATATGVCVDEYSLVMGRLCEAFEEFVASSARIGEIAQRAIATVIKVHEGLSGRQRLTGMRSSVTAGERSAVEKSSW